LNGSKPPGNRVVVVEGLSKNVHKGHLDEIFGVYGKILRIDLPIFAVCESSFGLEPPQWDFYIISKIMLASSLWVR
jgi:RNA-binding protein with serine-rich domain 1